MGYEEGEGEGEGEEEEEEEEYSEASPPTAVSDGKRKYKMGDAALRLDVVHLNAFQAMEETMKEMGYEEGEEGGEGEEEEAAEEGDAYRDGAPQAGPGRPAEPTPRPVPTGGGASGKRAQVQPAAAAAGSGGAARALGTASQPRRAFVPDPYKGEPPDFEPPPQRMCFEEEEEGAGRRVQIAILATVVLLLTGCVVRAPHRTCSASPHRHHAPTLPARQVGVSLVFASSR